MDSGYKWLIGIVLKNPQILANIIIKHNLRNQKLEFFSPMKDNGEQPISRFFINKRKIPK